MKYNPEFLEAIRKILNETRQDRLCRPFLAKRPESEILPFLGSTSPAYFFMGINPSGYDISGAPTQAEDYIEYATNYFDVLQNDRASFTSYLPYTANHSHDYSAFGQAACTTYLVPISTTRSSEVTISLARACWPRTRLLIESLKPNLILIHGALAWKFLTSPEDGQTILTDTGELHCQGIPELYEKLEADKLPFQSSLEGISSQYKPWIVPLPHLGGTGGAKESRRKAEQAVQTARRRLSGGPLTITSGSRIRVRRPD